MSNTAAQMTSECAIHQGCQAVELVIRPKDKDLGGFNVRRALPNQRLRHLGPWVFFDHMGPASFVAGSGINVRPHPHINLATVTYLFEGEILHRDSVGSFQAIKPGDVNLMVAGRGIVHSEREREEAKLMPRNLHGLQLWHALPEEFEEIEPAFYHYPNQQIPALDVEGVEVRVIMGSAYGVNSPVKTFTETLYIEASLKAGQRLILPYASERGLYVVSGSAEIGETQLPEHAMGVLSSEAQSVSILAVADSRIALIGGEPLGKRYMEWNFVSSRPERIEQAKADWRAQRFDLVAGDEQEFIPLP